MLRVDIASFSRITGVTQRNAGRILKVLHRYAYAESDLAGRVRRLAQALGLKRRTLACLINRYPAVLTRRPEALKHALAEVKQVLDVPMDKARKLILQAPRLLTLKTGEMERRVTAHALALHASREMLAKAARRSAHFIMRDPGTVAAIRGRYCAWLGCGELAGTQMLLKQPSLFGVEVSVAEKNVKASAAALDLSEEAFVRMALRHPVLLYSTPERLAHNARAAMRSLGMTAEAYAAILQHRPQILSLKGERFAARVLANAEALGVGASEIMDLAARKADYFVATPAALRDKRRALAELLRLCGQSKDLPALLRGHPAAVSYSIAYIEMRCELASRLPAPPKAMTLLALSNASVQARIEELGNKHR